MPGHTYGGPWVMTDVAFKLRERLHEAGETCWLKVRVPDEAMRMRGAVWRHRCVDGC